MCPVFLKLFTRQCFAGKIFCKPNIYAVYVLWAHILQLIFDIQLILSSPNPGSQAIIDTDDLYSRSL